MTTNGFIQFESNGIKVVTAADLTSFRADKLADDSYDLHGYATIHDDGGAIECVVYAHNSGRYSVLVPLLQNKVG